MINEEGGGRGREGGGKEGGRKAVERESEGKPEADLEVKSIKERVYEYGGWKRGWTVEGSVEPQPSALLELLQ